MSMKQLKGLTEAQRKEIPQTLSGVCLYASQKYNKKMAFSMICDGKIERQITYTEMGERSKKIAATLRNMGIQKGDRVLLLSENNPEWALAYFGIALAGAVSVPLLTGFSIEQIDYIAKHSAAKAACFSKSIAEKVDIGLPVICIDNMLYENINHKDIDEIITENDYSQVQTPDELASIIYTSGTQGSSKGVMLSSSNLLASTLSSYYFKDINSKDHFLSVLPLAHSYECGIGFLLPVISGSSVTYLDRPPSVSVLLPALKLIRPTAMLTVPLLIEKIYNNGIAPKLNKSILYKFPVTRKLAILVAGRKLKSSLGGRIRFFGIGGAALCPQVEKFLHSAGFPYAIGYGLTETAPLIAGNSPRRFSYGSGIWAPAGVKIRIAKTDENNNGEGEIQVQGPNVMLGYFNDAEKTTDAFSKDGWLRTGDLGLIDRRGWLHIKGRLKAMILGPSGENIYPEEIEGLLGSSQLVEESLVYSGKKGELVAMVFLNEAAKAAAGAVGAMENAMENAMEDLRTWVNKKLSAFSRISRIEIRKDPFEKTATMKIKRYLYI